MLPAMLTTVDGVALVTFLLAWLLYEPILQMARRPGSTIHTNMPVIRRAWMRNLVARENQFMDGQLLGQVLSSSTFLASSNLLLMAAATSTLFHGEDSYRSAAALGVLKTSSRELFELQIGLIVLALARGLLAFIWAIRQLNYCLAALGGSPHKGGRRASAEAYANAFSRLLNPALSAFGVGVRGYYFAAVAAAWLFGPWTFLCATVAALALLLWRQTFSPAAAAIAEIRAVLEGAGVDPSPDLSSANDPR